MRLCSMTGFSRVTGSSDLYRWSVELKSVNAKGFDLRMRVAPGFERIEAEIRAALTRAFARGTLFATLNSQRDGARARAQIDSTALEALARAAAAAAKSLGLAPPTMDGLLNIRGIVDIDEADTNEPASSAACEGLLASLHEAILALSEARQREGDALSAILGDKMKTISGLTRAAEANPGRRPEAVRARLAQSLAALMESGRAMDENRLYQEAVLLAAKADVREELDRLVTHIAAVEELLANGGPIGRRLDFLAQELGREANTLCAKSNDVSLTAIGLDLRGQIEQLREQVQNIE